MLDKPDKPQAIAICFLSPLNNLNCLKWSIKPKLDSFHGHHVISIIKKTESKYSKKIISTKTKFKYINDYRMFKLASWRSLVVKFRMKSCWCTKMLSNKPVQARYFRLIFCIVFDFGLIIALNIFIVSLYMNTSNVIDLCFNKLINYFQLFSFNFTMVSSFFTLSQLVFSLLLFRVK